MDTSNKIHTVELSPKGYIYSLIVGETTAIEAEKLSKSLANILENHSADTFNVIVDLVGAKTASPEAVKIYGGMMKNHKIGKIAFVGGTDVARISAHLAQNFAHKDEVRFFSSKEEATNWIQG